MIKSWVLQIRQELPRVGGRKLYYMIQSKLKQHQISYGRDKFFALLKKEGLLAHLRRKYTKTTMSRHWLRKYPNLIKEIAIDRPDRVWVADITYIRTFDGYHYLHLITDAFSRKIIGHCFSENLSSKSSLTALEKALDKRKHPHQLIHHSDRGIQYCSHDYIAKLEKSRIVPSMTENSDPYENAIAERVNGILKHEFFLDNKFETKELASIAVEQAIKLYNEKRPHLNLDYQTPEEVYNFIN